MTGPTQSLRPDPAIPTADVQMAQDQDKSKKKALVENVQGIEAQEAALMPEENKKLGPTQA